jgi:hypothetical protein
MWCLKPISPFRPCALEDIPKPVDLFFSCLWQRFRSLNEKIQHEITTGNFLYRIGAVKGFEQSAAPLLQDFFCSYAVQACDAHKSYCRVLSYLRH